MASAETGKFQTVRGTFKPGRELAKELFHASIRTYIINDAKIPPDLSGEIGVPRREITDTLSYEREKLKRQKITAKP